MCLGGACLRPGRYTCGALHLSQAWSNCSIKNKQDTKTRLLYLFQCVSLGLYRLMVNTGHPANCDELKVNDCSEPRVNSEKYRQTRIHTLKTG